MKLLVIGLCATVLVVACKEASKPVPDAPKSIAEVKDAIKGKKYKVSNLGLLSPFKSDAANPVDWKVQEQDTSKFFREYAAKLNQYTLDVSADSAVSFLDMSNNKLVKGTYSVDNGTDDEEIPGIKLRLKYSDSLDFGGRKNAAVMTQSYIVRGVAANELVVETSNAFNNRKVVLWLQAH